MIGNRLLLAVAADRVDLDLFRLDGFRLRKRKSQDTVIKDGFDLVGINRHVHGHDTLELTGGAFAEQVIAILGTLLEFAPDGQDIPF